MTSWKNMFEINWVDWNSGTTQVFRRWIASSDKKSGWYIYKLPTSETSDKFGPYLDLKYAQKQAKYKFKKEMSKINKILLKQVH
jgi:hypothetical protein